MWAIINELEIVVAEAPGEGLDPSPGVDGRHGSGEVVLEPGMGAASTDHLAVPAARRRAGEGLDP